MKPKKPAPQQASEHFLYEAIASIHTADQAKAFLEDLCTPTELQALVDRWLVVPHLLAEKPYRAIHQETGVSVTTIGRVARALNLGTGGYKKVFEQMKKK